MQVAQRIYSRFVTPLPLRQQYQWFLLLLLQLLSVPPFPNSGVRPTSSLRPSLPPPPGRGSPCRSLLAKVRAGPSFLAPRLLADFRHACKRGEGDLGLCTGIFNFSTFIFPYYPQDRTTNRAEQISVGCVLSVLCLATIGSFDDDTKLLGSQ